MIYQRLYVWQNGWRVIVDGWTADALPQSFLDDLAAQVPLTYAVLYVWDGTRWSTARNY